MTSGLLHLAAHPAAAPQFPIAHAIEGMTWAGWILWLPVISAVLCGLCAALRVKGKLPAWITVGLLGASFAVTASLYAGYEEPIVVTFFDWFDLHWTGGSLVANFGAYIDRLTLLWMLFVTGLGTLIALYASEYMEADVGKGYARFFGGVSIFLFAMGSLVMADNLVMLYLGWEGVGLASYLLIGYYYKRPSAVAAAKKAFVMNRIGDLGLALGIYLTYHAFGTVEYRVLFELLAGEHAHSAGGWTVTAIPYLFFLGAVGKSAQLPLFVWLPDAMEGPTPVSALIHAATMVTAGVYLVARMYPVFLLEPASLQLVAWIGGLTAILSATIALAQYDIKRIMAYSTVSQLGYMFLGLGVATSFGGAYHVFTHAFFKAVLFLACGAIMHGFAGQLDLRKLSGVGSMRGWKVTSWTMLYACACLAGLPLITNGFYSKDLIMAQAFITPGYAALGVIAMFTAVLTGYYAFRVWFRVFAGPEHYEMGDEHHGDDDHGHATPHPPRLAINFVLLAISAGAIASIFMKDWAHGMVEGSTAAAGTVEVHHEDAGFWHDPHRWMPFAAGTLTVVAIAIAWYFHLFSRRSADAMRARLLASPATRWLPIAMENKWYVDELYDFLLRKPLWAIGHVFTMLDRYLIDGVLVDGTASLPRRLGRSFQPLMNGVLHSYALTMAGGVALVAVLVLVMPDLVAWLRDVMGATS